MTQKNRHVWFLNHYAQEPGHAGGTRHYSIARHLPKHSWNASIIAASVELNTNRQRISSDASYQIDRYGDIPFLWLRTPMYAGNGLGRMRNMLSYARRALSRSATSSLEQPAVIVGSSVHPFAAWAGLRIARRLRVPFVFEVRDLWPQTLVDLGRISDTHIVTRLLRKLERHLYEAADQIVVLLPDAWRYIEPLGISRDKIKWIPNGVELEDTPPASPIPRRSNFDIMYFGAHGTANGLDVVLDAMQLVELDPAQDHISLRLIGNGPLKPTLVEHAKKLGLKRVTFEDPVSKTDIPKLAAEADAFVFNLIDAPVFNYGISSNKLFDFLAAARPIVFCCKSSNNPVEEAQAGITVAPGDVKALAKAIASVASMPVEQRESMGQAGRQFVAENHDFRVLAQKFASVLDDCISDNP